MAIRRSLIIFALILILAFSACNSSSSYQAVVQDSLIDLSDWDFSAQGNVSLNGSWAFYWDELLSPGSFDDTVPTGYFTVPFYWTKYPGLDLPSYGSATYRLVVKTDGSPRLYGVKTPEIYTEYALWVNGDLLDANGNLTGDETVYLHPQIYDFYSEATELEIVLQVKNNAHVYGGVGQSIRLGTSELIHKEQNTDAAIDLVLISIGLFTGLYYAVLYLFRRNNRELIWFFVLCVSVVLRNLFSNTTLIMQLFPAMPFWIGSKLVTISVPVIIISMLFYTKIIYDNEIQPLAFKSLLTISILYAAAVMCAPSGFYSFLFTPYLLTVGAACLLGIYQSFRAVILRKRDSLFFLAGILMLTTGAVLDSLIYMQRISMRYTLSAALFGFIILQVVLLAKRYAQAFLQAEVLSNELQTSLDKLKNTETAFMSAQMKPHFLYNTLTTIAEKCVTDPNEAGRLILSLSKYLRHTLDYDNLSGTIPLKKEMELIYAYTSIELARFTNIAVVFDLPDPLPALQLPPLTLQPLVENAIKHGLRKRRKGGRVTVSMRKHEDRVAFIIEDNGVGIPEILTESLFVSPNGSASIGLYNINTRLIRLYGKGLKIESKKGSGTTVCFEVPFSKED